MNILRHGIAASAAVACLALLPQHAFAQSTLQLAFAPIKATDASVDCPGANATPVTKLSTKGIAGSTKKNTFHTVGVLFYRETAGNGVANDFTNAKLLVTCRGNGQVRVTANDCTSVVATIDCEDGLRPVAVISAAFTATPFISYDVQVKANDPGDVLDYADPKLVVF